MPLRPTLAGLLAVAVAAAAAGCSTSKPPPIDKGSLAEARVFPYFEVYWAGPRFEGNALAAVDGLRSYLPSVGDSVYYGDCVAHKGIFGGGSCLLPLQVTTVMYTLHKNATLGPQRNTVIRGVPAVVYDEGRSIELYTGRVAVDIFSDTYSHASAAAQELLPINASGSATGNLPPPVYCPELYGPQDDAVRAALEKLPRFICGRTE
ncbi:MAG TPA: hypothetical protein VGX51_04775, partial [Solirubrobacteraceae bacterium]|nr:hypothetical protein [Solirubrobacteraceae bacterium]